MVSHRMQYRHNLRLSPNSEATSLQDTLGSNVHLSAEQTTPDIAGISNSRSATWNDESAPLVVLVRMRPRLRWV